MFLLNCCVITFVKIKFMFFENNIIFRKFDFGDMLYQLVPIVF